MDGNVIGILVVDGLSNGAVYALLAMALVLVFAVTRIIFIPQGEFVAFGALSMALFQEGRVPGTVWLLLALAILSALIDAVGGWRRGAGVARLVTACMRSLALPLLLSLASFWLAPMKPGLWVQALLSLALATALGPLLYRLVYRSVADASVLALLIISVGVHFVLTGLALVCFGAEGFRNTPFWDARLSLGGLSLAGQAVLVLLCSTLLIGALFLFFERTLAGKALRATAVNRLGARLMGISTVAAGELAFTLAAFIGSLSGLLIGPTTTLFYDSGFLIGLKGFVAAVFAGLASFPGALLGAVLLGLLESFSSFWASAFKEVIVFTAILPMLLWRSLADRFAEEH